MVVEQQPPNTILGYGIESRIRKSSTIQRRPQEHWFRVRRHS